MNKLIYKSPRLKIYAMGFYAERRTGKHEKELTGEFLVIHPNHTEEAATILAERKHSIFDASRKRHIPCKPFWEFSL